MAASYITPELFSFLSELKANNNRPWFQANKARYEAVVRDPMLQFIEDFRPRLKKISRHLQADPRPVGGSLFRIYRDTRFSPDKRPYKTNVAARFPHAAGKEVPAPGFYLHLEPGQVYLGSGMWHPPREALFTVREAIVAEPAKWKRMIRKLKERGYTLEGDSLKRIPRGFDQDHPLAEDLRRTDYITSSGFTEREACEPDFMDRVEEGYKEMAPLPRYLASALGIAW